MEEKENNMGVVYRNSSNASSKRKPLRATDKFTCSRCGRRGTIRGGHIAGYTTADTYRGEYICNACMRKMREEKAKQMIQDVLKGVPREPSAKEIEQQENNAMLNVMKKLCTTSGWYKLRELASVYNYNIVYLMRKVVPSQAAKIIERLGFTEKKIGAQGYTFFWIDSFELANRLHNILPNAHVNS